MTVGIIGGGPAGCFLGAKLKWDDAIIFDARPEVGKPVRCTGILTESVEKLLKVPSDVVINHIKSFRFKAPNGKTLDIDLKRKDTILDREKFDQYLAQRAIDNGCKIKYHHKLIDWKDKFKLKFDKDSYDVDYLVGADGPYSTVAKRSGMYGERKVMFGYQARVEGNFEEHTTEVLLGRGEFAWIVPESNKIARVGIVGDSIAGFKKLISNYKLLEHQSGPIPIYNHKQIIQKGNIALIGDAATQVKSTTYGGIVYGMNAAKLIAEKWDGYEKRFNSELGKELWIGNKIRHLLNKLSVKDYNDLVDIFSRPRNRKILASYDRNYPSKMMRKLILEPKFWKYGFKLF